MMKMQMHLDKTQVADLVDLVQVFTTPNLTPVYFDRSLLSMAGYTNFDMVAVGGAGGSCGTAWGDTDHLIDMKPCGGGGGGSIRVQGKLADLPEQTMVIVGYAGSDGNDSLVRGKAPDGTSGGGSNFAGNYIAYPGRGAIGGKYARPRYGFNNDYHIEPDVDSSRNYMVSKGGNGGGNSHNLGTGGKGGECEFVSWDDTQGVLSDPGTAQTPATAGTWVVNPVDASGTIISGGVGGGGGAGDVDVHSKHYDRTDGKSGSVGGNANAPGGTTSTQVGGAGGGADIGVVTGVTSSYYGSKVSGTISTGAVAIKVS